MQEIQRKSNSDKNSRNIVLYIVTAILVVILIILIIFSLIGKNKKTESKQSIYTADESKTAGKNVFEENAYPEVGELVKQYFEACAVCDYTVLNQIVSTVSDSDKELLERKREYVEKYEEVVTYAKLGPIEDSYIVFATYNMKFVNMDTTVPGMETLYIRTDDNGKMYIYKGEIEAEVSSYIATAVNSDDAKKIIDEVNKKYLNVLAANSDVLSFIEKFEGDSDLIEEAKKMAEEAKTAQAAADEEKKKQEEEAAKVKQEEETKAAEAAANAEQKNEKVAVVQTINVRESNSETASKVGSVAIGEVVTRVSVTNDGWSKIQFSGGEGYAKSDYLATFTFTEDKVKPTTVVNVRSECSETANMVGQLDIDSTYTRNANYDNGWSQIMFDGVAAYVKTEYLTK